jgi:hypothetical protein
MYHLIRKPLIIADNSLLLITMDKISNHIVTQIPSLDPVGAGTDASRPKMASVDGTSLEAPPKRKPGRPKGLGKVPGSGRKAGTPNKLTKDVRNYILEKGKPLELLFKISCGHKIKVGDADGNAKRIYPSLADRASAAKVLLSKVLPDIKATEISGPDGGPIETRVGSLDPIAETARRFAFIMASCEVAEPGSPETPAINHEPVDDDPEGSEQ